MESWVGSSVCAAADEDEPVREWAVAALEAMGAPTKPMLWTWRK